VTSSLKVAVVDSGGQTVPALGPPAAWQADTGIFQAHLKTKSKRHVERMMFLEG